LNFANLDFEERVLHEKKKHQEHEYRSEFGTNNNEENTNMDRSEGCSSRNEQPFVTTFFSDRNRRGSTV
jgi:hypothetical protein